MAEGGYDTTPKPGERFGYLRNLYKPKREQAERLLQESNIKSGKKFRGARKKIAREILAVEQAGYTDQLTGLLNRTGFNKRLNEEVGKMRRDNSRRMFVRIDLNFFKEVNYTRGHDKGDEMLKKVGEILIEESRVSDIVSRMGGDEFDAILTTDSPEGAQEWWTRINPKLKLAGISAGAGVSELNPSDISGSIKKADQVLNRAKAKSKVAQDNIMIAA